MSTNNVEKLRLKKFDMAKVGDNKVLVFIGKRNTGKSVLVLDYLTHNLDIPIGTVVSPTDEFNCTFKGKVPDIFIHSEISSKLLKSFLTRQENQTKKATKDPTIDPRAFLVLDDCMADSTSWVNDRTIKFLFMNGRHVKTTLIITLQDPVGIPPKLRSNIDYVFVCKDTNRQNREKLFKMYAGMFTSFQEFEDTMLQCCDNYNCMVLYKNSQSYKIEDQVFWYKADLERVKNFRTCAPIYWEIDRRLKNNKKDDDREVHDNLLRLRKSNNNVTIVKKLEQSV